MKKDSSTLRIILALVVALGMGAGLRAQEPSEPPPPPAREGRGIMQRFGGPEMRFANRVVTGAPYSAQAVTEINQTLSDGNQIHRTLTATLYRDSEGRTRREETIVPLGILATSAGNGRQVVLINDPVAGVNYVLHPPEHTAMKMPANFGQRAFFARRQLRTGEMPPGGPGPMTMPPPPLEGMEGGKSPEERMAAQNGNVQTESLGSQVIGGVQADGTRTTVTIPAGQIGNVKPIQIVTERWYSTQLQAVVMSKRSDPRFGETTYRLTNINQAEPAPALFQVPADYKIQDTPRERRMLRRNDEPTPNQ